MNFRLKTIYCILLFFAVFNAGKWVVHFTNAPYHPIDFRTYYMSSEAFWQGSNPYDDRSQEIQWKLYQANTDSNWTGLTGFPHASAVYAPQFVWYFGLFNILEFNTAKYLQFFLNILSLITICFVVSRLNLNIPITGIILVLCAFKGTWYALNTGQPMLQILAISMLVLHLIQLRKSRLLAGILLGFVAFKFTLMIPFILYLFIRKEFKALIVFFITSILLNISALYIFGMETEYLQSWTQNMANLWSYPHQYQTLNGLNIISTSISIPLRYYYEIPLIYAKLSMLVLLILSCLSMLYFKRKLNGFIPLLLGTITMLCFGQHLIYDLLVLLCFSLLVYQKNQSMSVFEITLLIFICMPSGEISNRFGLDFIHMTLPILLFIYFLILFKTYLFSKNTLIKKPS